MPLHLRLVGIFFLVFSSCPPHCYMVVGRAYPILCLKPLYNSPENYWLYGAECFADKIEVGIVPNWTKDLIKQNTYNFWLKSVQDELHNRQKLKYMHDFVLPHMEKN